MRLYEEGYKLQENEYLLKIRLNTGHRDYQVPKTGFMTKFNKDGSMPVAFKNWDANRWSVEKPEIPIYVHTEDFKEGWKLYSCRFGQSQNWAALIHPDGFTVEVYLEHFLGIIETNTLVNGEIKGKFKWKDYELIKE